MRHGPKILDPHLSSSNVQLYKRIYVKVMFIYGKHKWKIHSSFFDVKVLGYVPLLVDTYYILSAFHPSCIAEVHAIDSVNNRPMMLLLVAF